EVRAARHSGTTSWNKRSRNIDRISVGVAIEGAPLAGLTDAQIGPLHDLVGAIQQRHGLPPDAFYLWAGDIDLAEGQSLLRPAALPALPRPRGPVVLHADDTDAAATPAPAAATPAPAPAPETPAPASPPPPVTGSGPFPIP